MFQIYASVCVVWKLADETFTVCSKIIRDTEEKNGIFRSIYFGNAFSRSSDGYYILIFIDKHLEFIATHKRVKILLCDCFNCV